MNAKLRHNIKMVGMTVALWFATTAVAMAIPADGHTDVSCYFPGQESVTVLDVEGFEAARTNTTFAFSKDDVTYIVPVTSCIVRVHAGPNLIIGE